MFPPPGADLSVLCGSERLPSRVEAEECDCRPPHHRHLHLDARAFRDRVGFRAGTVLAFEKVAEGSFRVTAL